MIPISEIEQNREKEIEQRLRSESTEEFNKKKKGSRSKIGLILSGIGGIIYLIFFFLAWSWGETIIIPYLSTGAISIMGTIIAAKKPKIGGTVILFSIPLSLFITLFFGYHSSTMILFVVLLLMPFPLPVLVIIGGIAILWKRQPGKPSRWKQVKPIT